VVPAELTIGDFSRITHLSVKTLRHYHRVGLLEPDEVNARTGYRYYSVAQVRSAHVIRRFRELGMPVEQVRAVLTAPDPAARDALIAEHLDRLQDQLERTQSAVASLRSLLEGNMSAPAVERRHVNEVAAVGIREMVARADIGRWWSDAFAELYGALSRHGARPTGPAGGLYADELFTEEGGEALVFVPVDATTDVPSGGRVRALTVPAADLAVTVHAGPDHDADRTYAALGTYVAENGLGAPGPVREYYLVGARETADVTSWRTEICWPIQP
jgi:DNA-binding transcriptional MerR regulator